MNFDRRLSNMLHLLAHLMGATEPVSSERLAAAFNANPVVLRRTLASLRDAGLVTSGKGHGGGWVMACDPSTTTLLDVYRALGAPPLFAFGNRSEHPTCLIEQAVNGALDDTMLAAEALITARLQTLTLTALITDAQHRFQLCENPPQEHTHAL